MALMHRKVEEGRKAATTGRNRPALLLRRLTITCPVTGLPTDTGFELTEVPALGSSSQVLIDCLECGQDHEWDIDDVVLEALPSMADASVHRSDP
jgi:hypothetical protein